jgi:hypothetical protein
MPPGLHIVNRHQLDQQYRISGPFWSPSVNNDGNSHRDMEGQDKIFAEIQYSGNLNKDFSEACLK